MKKDGKNKRHIAGKIVLCFVTFILLIVVGVIGALYVLYYGPSPSARDRFVLTVTETSAGDFLATWFLPDETVKAIQSANYIQESEDITDTKLIVIPGSNRQKGEKTDDTDNPQTDSPSTEPVTDPEYDRDKIELIDVKGKTYNGKMLIVYNPKRVTVGTPDAYGEDKKGVTTINMVKNENALYGVNGGGFYDTGKGNGGVPTGRDNSDGIVISEGKLLWGKKTKTYEVIGINKDGILVLGKMTAQKALDMGIVEALNFGPYLIQNGEPCVVQGYSESSLNPRTAIGQRSDGAMLILTVDGRQPTSLGASYEDLIEIMMRFGAVNAANLDGGSSTYMVQNSETENNPKIITQTASLYGPRKMATTILVSRDSPD